MNDSQRLAHKIARECRMFGVKDPVITVPQCVLDLLSRELSEGMLVTGKLSGGPYAWLKFAGVTFKGDVKDFGAVAELVDAPSSVQGHRA